MLVSLSPSLLPSVSGSYHTVAVAHAFLSNYRTALDMEKRCKQILSSSLPARHSRLQQTQLWLDHLTSLAVKQATIAGSPAASSPAAASSLSSSLSALQVMPPQLALNGPYAWVAFERGAKPRLGLDDVLQLVEISSRADDKRTDDLSRQADAQLTAVAPAVTAEAEEKEQDGEGEEEEAAVRPLVNGSAHGDALRATSNGGKSAFAAQEPEGQEEGEGQGGQSGQEGAGQRQQSVSSAVHHSASVQLRRK